MAAAAAKKKQQQKKKTCTSAWSDLPTDLVVSILERLSTVDYIRFGAVCTAWRSTWKQRLCRPAAPRVPWLMSSAGIDHGSGGADVDARSFFDLSTGKTYTMSLPELRGRHCLGTSADGDWVVYVGDDLELRLLHLAAAAGQRVVLPLPPLSTVWVVRSVERDPEGRPLLYWYQMNRFPGLASLTPEELLRYFFSKARVLFLDDDSPGRRGGGARTPLVVFVHGYLATVSVARPGDAAWTKLECHFGIRDVVLHRGRRLCAVDSHGNTIAWDPCDASSPVAWSEPVTLGPAMNNLDFPQKYLVSDGGELWQVWRDVQFTHDPDSVDGPMKYETVAVRTFNLDHHPTGDRWSEVKSLDGRVFFLGNNYPLVLRSAADEVDARKKKNCIYFTDDGLLHMLVNEQVRSNDRDIGVYSLEDGSWEPLPLPAGVVIKYPTPIWATPSLQPSQKRERGDGEPAFAGREDGGDGAASGGAKIGDGVTTSTAKAGNVRRGASL